MTSADNTTSAQLPLLNNIKEHWLWIAPLLYVYLCILGMLDAWQRFGAFGIRIFEFMEPKDFIISAFRDPTLVLALLHLTILGICMVMACAVLEHHKIQQLFYRLHPNKSEPRRRPFKLSARFYLSGMLCVLALSGYGATFFWNSHYDKDWKASVLHDLDRQVDVVFAQRTNQSSSFLTLEPVVFIGSTSNYLFFYCEITRGYIVSPSHNVLQMRRLDTARISERALPTTVDSC